MTSGLHGQSILKYCTPFISQISIWSLQINSQTEIPLFFLKKKSWNNEKSVQTEVPFSQHAWENLKGKNILSSLKLVHVKYWTKIKETTQYWRSVSFMAWANRLKNWSKILNQWKASHLFQWEHDKDFCETAASFYMCTTIRKHLKVKHWCNKYLTGSHKCI